jgi:hypothetical protein
MSKWIIIQQLKLYLKQMIKTNTSFVFDSAVDPHPSIGESIAGLDQEIQDLENQARNLISKHVKICDNFTM